MKNQDESNLIKVDKNKIKNWKQVFGYIAIILSLIPIVVIVYTLVYSELYESEGPSVAGWSIIIYYIYLAIPIFALSLAFGKAGLNSNNKIPSYISFIINIIKVLLIALFLLIMNPRRF